MSICISMLEVSAPISTATINNSIEKLGFQPTSESVYNSIIGLGLASYYTKHNLLCLARAG